MREEELKKAYLNLPLKDEQYLGTQKYGEQAFRACKLESCFLIMSKYLLNIYLLINGKSLRLIH